MPNNKYTYNMPVMVKMFGENKTLKEIAKSGAVEPEGCALSRIGLIRELWMKGEIDTTKKGTLKELRLNGNTEEDDVYYENNYIQTCYELLWSYLKIKSRNINNIAPNELKLAYFFFSKKLHPDLNNGDYKANEKFIALKKAYDSLQRRLFGGILFRS